MNNKHEDSEEKGGKWLTTFNDMVTLLLTFLVLVLSLSKIDESKLIAASYAMNAVFDIPKLSKENVEVFTPFVIPIKKRVATFENKKRELAERVNKAARMAAGATGDRASASPEGTMNAKVIKEGVSVILGEKLLFKTGMAEIEKRKYPVLNALSSILKKTDCQIRVEGHTDDVPIDRKLFSSNWELSVARAANVVKYFIFEGSILPERLSVASYADSKPLFPNVSDHNRELNRRVAVLLILNRNDGGLDDG